MYLVIGADLVPTESNYDAFSSGNTNLLFGETLKKYLESASYRIFNLEMPLTDDLNPIPKCGPNLIAPTKTINAYVSAGVDLLTLANNHIMDQDVDGMLSTCKTLASNNIAYLGVGNNLSDALKPYYFDFAGKKIGVYACCEHEFGIATEFSAGANPFDPMESFDHISDMKKQCDYIIVLYHGGKEHYRYPSPMLQKICRKFIDTGANTVICQHSHCIGCEEKYKDGSIVYGQGNFLFDRKINDCWDTSLLISLDENMSISFFPLVKYENYVRIATDDIAEKILLDFNKRSSEIKTPGFVEKKYKEFSVSSLDNYLFSFSGIKKSFLYKVLNKLTKHKLTKFILTRKYSTERKLILQNFIECEAHRELIIQGLKSNSSSEKAN